MANIKLDPALLTSQSQQMNALAGEYQNLFSSVVATLKSMDDCWSEVLSANFTGKITTAQNSFSNVTELLQQGGQAAQLAATTLQDVDTALANIMSGKGSGNVSITGGNGALGGGGSGGGRSSSSIWQQIKDYFSDSWDKAGNAFKYLEELYGKLPEGVRNGIDKVIYATMGGSGKAAIQITSDILTGDLSWDTLKTALTAMGTDNTEISVIVNGLKSVFQNETVKDLRASCDAYNQASIQAFMNGDIVGGLENLASGFGAHMSAIGYGIADTVTEVGADLIQGTVGRVASGISGVTDVIGEGLSAIGCETIGNAISSAGEAVSSAVNWITGSIRKIF